MTTANEATGKLERVSIMLISLSPIAYCVWLLVPAIQNACGAIGGLISCGLFPLGLLLDPDELRHSWKSLLVRFVCLVALPAVLILYLGRGSTEQFIPYYVQFLMFFYPVTYCGYAREKNDARLWKYLKWVLLCCVILTTMTTVGWLIQGILRSRTEGRIFAYSRSLGYAGEGEAQRAYLKELMGRNIGGYDFIYAMIVALPFCCITISRCKKYRVLLILLAVLISCMIVLSQYTYAILYMAAFWMTMLISWALRRISARRIKFGAALMLSSLIIVVLALCSQHLVNVAENVAESVHMNSLAHSFKLLRDAINGVVGEDSRLAYYQIAMRSFSASPLLGSITSGVKQFSQHSDVLDLLSGVGLIGAAAFVALVYGTGHGMYRGLKKSSDFAMLICSLVLLLLTATLGTVVYSRDVSAVLCFGALSVLEDGKKV